MKCIGKNVKKRIETNMLDNLTPYKVSMKRFEYIMKQLDQNVLVSDMTRLCDYIYEPVLFGEDRKSQEQEIRRSSDKSCRAAEFVFNTVKQAPSDCASTIKRKIERGKSVRVRKYIQDMLRQKYRSSVTFYGNIDVRDNNFVSVVDGSKWRVLRKHGIEYHPALQGFVEIKRNKYKPDVYGLAICILDLPLLNRCLKEKREADN